MFELSKEGKEFVKSEMNRYEDKHSAIIPCLYKIQEENKGWVSPEAVDHLSALMGIPQTHISEVLGFYTMFNKEPIGKYHVQVCCNITCSMYNGREVVEHICKKFGIKPGDISSDGRFTVSKVECLGSCDNAPAVQINDKYYNSVTLEKVDQILEGLK